MDLEKEPALHRFSSILAGGFSCNKRAPPKAVREHPSLVNFMSKYIFVIGGKNEEELTSKSTSYYEFAKDKWFEDKA